MPRKKRTVAVENGGASGGVSSPAYVCAIPSMSIGGVVFHLMSPVLRGDQLKENHRFQVYLQRGSGQRAEIGEAIVPFRGNYPGSFLALLSSPHAQVSAILGGEVIRLFPRRIRVEQMSGQIVDSQIWMKQDGTVLIYDSASGQWLSVRFDNIRSIELELEASKRKPP